MFFEGHMVWGYLSARATSSLTKARPAMPLVLLVSILPDVDIFLEPFGIKHLTVTHAIFTWLVLFAPVFGYFGFKKTLPYFFAVLQHFLLGDAVMGPIPLLWPATSVSYGLSFEMKSAMDLSLEGFGFALFLGVSYRTGDLAAMFNGDPVNAWSMLPAGAVLVSFTPLRYYSGFMPLSFIALNAAFAALLSGSFVWSLFRHLAHSPKSNGSLGLRQQRVDHRFVSTD